MDHHTNKVANFAVKMRIITLVQIILLKAYVYSHGLLASMESSKYLEHMQTGMTKPYAKTLKKTCSTIPSVGHKSFTVKDLNLFNPP